MNNYSFHLRDITKCLVNLQLPFMNRNENLPYFFDERIYSKYSAYYNMKHKTMLTVCSMLIRSTELCNLMTRHRSQSPYHSNKEGKA